MPHCDWYNPAPLSAWITPELPDVHVKLEKLGYEVLTGGAVAEQAYRPQGAVYRPTVAISVDQKSHQQLIDAADMLLDTAARHIAPFRFVLHVVSEQNVPLGALDRDGCIAREEALCEGLFQRFNLESDVHGIAWTIECGRREVFRQRRTIRCSSESIQQLSRDPIARVLGKIPTGQLLDLSIGSIVSGASAKCKWIDTARIRQLGERLQLLEWINGKILLNKSKVVGKELLFQYPQHTALQAAQQDPTALGLADSLSMATLGRLSTKSPGDVEVL